MHHSEKAKNFTTRLKLILWRFISPNKTKVLIQVKQPTEYSYKSRILVLERSL